MHKKEGFQVLSLVSCFIVVKCIYVIGIQFLLTFLA